MLQVSQSHQKEVNHTKHYTTMLLETISNGGGAVSLDWFSTTLFSFVIGLLIYIWNKQINQQQEHTKVLNAIAVDIAVMKSNSTTTTNDVKHIREEVDGVREELKDVRSEIGLVDKRVYKLEIAK